MESFLAYIISLFLRSPSADLRKDMDEKSKLMGRCIRDARWILIVRNIRQICFPISCFSPSQSRSPIFPATSQALVFSISCIARITGKAGRVGCKCAAYICRCLPVASPATISSAYSRFLPYSARGRISACHDLARYGQIRHDIKSIPGRRTEPHGNLSNFVEDHQRAVPVAELPDALVVVIDLGLV